MEISELKTNFLNELRNANVELAPNVNVTINSDRILISILDIHGVYFFGSDVSLTPEITENYGFGDFHTEAKIIFGSSGSFNPTNIGSYWRTIHAASLLKNWDAVVPIVNKYCKIYEDFRNNL